MVVCQSKNLLDDTPLSQASQLPQGLRGVQAVQCAICKGFGVDDQMLGGTFQVALVARKPLSDSTRGGRCAAQEVADLGPGIFEAEVWMIWIAGL